MQIKRLLDDRLVVTGDRLINSQGEHCEFVDHANGQLVAVSLDGKNANGQLVVTAEDERPTRFKLDELDCYVIHVTRTDRGLAKDRLRSFWED